MDLVEGAFSSMLEKYPDMEMTFLRLQYYNMPNNVRQSPLHSLHLHFAKLAHSRMITMLVRLEHPK